MEQQEKTEQALSAKKIKEMKKAEKRKQKEAKKEQKAKNQGRRCPDDLRHGSDGTAPAGGVLTAG